MARASVLFLRGRALAVEHRGAAVLLGQVGVGAEASVREQVFLVVLRARLEVLDRNAPSHLNAVEVMVEVRVLLHAVRNGRVDALTGAVGAGETCVGVLIFAQVPVVAVTDRDSAAVRAHAQGLAFIDHVGAVQQVVQSPLRVDLAAVLTHKGELSRISHTSIQCQRRGLASQQHKWQKPQQIFH